MKRLSRKQLITICVSAAAIVAIAAGYLYYARVYGNAAKITLYEVQSPDYDWKDDAADNNIVSDYLWTRTKKLMLSDDTVFIPSSYTIAGRLVTQEAENSGIYDLSDQALLLECYVDAGDRSSATALKKAVVENFKTSSGLYLSVMGDESGITAESDNIDWLEAYLEYYSLYGTSDDYEEIKSIVEALFDDNGELYPESLTVAHYVDTLYVASDEEDEETDPAEASLDQVYGAFVGADNEEEVIRDDQETNVSGVKISNIDLKLIYNLETNNLLPTGSYDSALSLVKGAYVSDSIPMYAYAYERTESGINYIYSGTENSAISMTENVKTMRNLAEMNQLDQNSFNSLRNLLFNNGGIYEYYYITTGNFSGAFAKDAYVDALAIAYCMNDADMYDSVCNMIGRRVASKSSSPALYMVFREEGGRYVFYAAENLGVRLVVG